MVVVTVQNEATVRHAATHKTVVVTVQHEAAVRHAAHVTLWHT